MEKNDFEDTMGPCYKEEFVAGSNDCVEHRVNLKCWCQRKHFLYVLFCKDHPFEIKFVPRGNSNGDIEEKCDCKKWPFSGSVQFLLSCSIPVKSNVVDEVTDYFIERVIPLDTYLKKINCNPFFFLSHKTRLIVVSLDNPHEDRIKAESDYKFMSSSKTKRNECLKEQF